MYIKVRSLPYAAVNFCHNHRPRTPGDLLQNFPPFWGFCILAFARGGGVVGVAPEGRESVYTRFLPFLEFSL